MMTKRSTKNALLSSVLALFLCFTMLLGTTLAWFTDSVTSANNIITAGLAVFQVGSVIVVDNSTSGTPITINKVDIAAGVDYTVAGNPSIAQ